MTAAPHELEQNGDQAPAPAEAPQNLPRPPVVLVGGMHDDEEQADTRGDDSSDETPDL